MGEHGGKPPSRASLRRRAHTICDRAQIYPHRAGHRLPHAGGLKKQAERGYPLRLSTISREIVENQQLPRQYQQHERSNIRSISTPFRIRTTTAILYLFCNYVNHKSVNGHPPGLGAAAHLSG